MTDTISSKRRSWRSVLFIGGIFCAALLAWGSMQLLSNPDIDQREVQVLDGAGQYHRYPLAENNTYSVTTELGTNTIEVKDGVVWMVSSTCPNQDCVHQGDIHGAGEMILCLPNQLLVSIVDESGDAKSNIDSISS